MLIENNKKLVEWNYQYMKKILILLSIIIFSLSTVLLYTSSKIYTLSVPFSTLFCVKFISMVVAQKLILLYLSSKYSDIKSIQIDEQQNRLRMIVTGIDKSYELFVYDISKIYTIDGVLYLGIEYLNLDTCRSTKSVAILNLDKKSKENFMKCINKFISSKKGSDLKL